MLKVEYSKQAVRFLSKLARQEARNILKKIGQYAKNPEELENKVRKLVGSPYIRLRVGDYRIIFTEMGEVMKIEKIGHRKDVYKRGV